MTGTWWGLEDMMAEHLIFVYGTLMKGERNHVRFLGSSAYTATAVLYGSDHPGAV